MPVFRYCPYCRSELVDFPQEEVVRKRCAACGWIHYRNPVPGVAVVLVEDGHLLIGHRRSGGWCIPCGYVEWGESIEEAALREFHEETGLHVQLDGVFAVRSNFHNPNVLTVGIWFRGSRVGGELRPGGDLIEVAFRPIPTLDGLIFPTDQEILELLRSES